jgi:H+-translocating NAD(P) transhydrogenase subunit alpha
LTDFLVLLAVFATSAAVAYRLISRIPQMLHTPLMSMTNAISAVTVLGALALFGSGPSEGEALVGGLALVLAVFNLAGGFAVTERMLRFFRRT